MQFIKKIIYCMKNILLSKSLCIMKSLLVFIVGGLLVVGCATIPQGIDLNGKWLGKGYTCPGNLDEDGQQLILDEEISISQDGGKVVATKITGDECVKAGEKTWEGKISGNWIEGVIYGRWPDSSKLETPSLPVQRIAFKVRVEIKSSNLLYLERIETLPGDEDVTGLEFVRISEDQQSKE